MVHHREGALLKTLWKIALVAALCFAALAALYIRFALGGGESLPGKIAYISREGTPGDIRVGEISNIWVVNADGSGARQVTDINVTGKYGTPAWSPDGRELVFSTGEIHLTNADGSNRRKLEQPGGPDLWPQFLPDGRIIYFARGGAYVMQRDGSGPKLLSPGATEGQVSPDATNVALVGGPTVFVRNLTTKRGRSVARSETNYIGSPAWSPAGDRIAAECAEYFTRPGSDVSEPGTLGICVINTDGSGFHKVAEEGMHPTWSPDGRWIAFEKNGDIYAANVENRKERRITTCEECADSYPSWSPQ